MAEQSGREWGEHDVSQVVGVQVRPGESDQVLDVSPVERVHPAPVAVPGMSRLRQQVQIRVVVHEVGQPIEEGLQPIPGGRVGPEGRRTGQDRGLELGLVPVEQRQREACAVPESPVQRSLPDPGLPRAPSLPWRLSQQGGRSASRLPGVDQVEPTVARMRR